MSEIPFYESTYQRQQYGIRPIGLVLHRTEASFDHCLQGFQRKKTPHFLVGKAYGQVAQFIDTKYIGAHVKGANSFYIGIEFESIPSRFEHRQDPLVNADDLTPYQVWMGYKLVDWICRTHAIPKIGPPTRSQWDQCQGYWHGIFGHANVAWGNFFATDHGDTLQEMDFYRLGVFPF